MQPVRYANRTAALLAAKAASKKRGYSDEQANLYSQAFAGRAFGANVDHWEAWYIHHVVNGKVFRRPVSPAVE